MNLSNEDSLRLNVLLVNSVAVRVDEGPMCVAGLLKDGNETRINLNANCRDDQYIRHVRELLSSTVLGSPGGYPVFLKRWTRMGQASNTRLQDLLMLGEPEAVVAVCGASALSDEIARRAWWAMPTAENARQMLRHETVVNGEMGKVLAEFLIEFLPFEQDPKAIIESVALVLQGDLIDQQTRESIWKRGKQKSVFRIGFLHTMPDALPEQAPARIDATDEFERLKQLAEQNRFASGLYNLFSSCGQSYLAACESILKKPANQDTVVSFFEALVEYLNGVQILETHYRDIDQLKCELNALLDENATEVHADISELKCCINNCPEFINELKAMLLLAHAQTSLLSPIFAHTDAVGSVMRKKIQPLTDPLFSCIRQLRKTAEIDF